MKSFLRPNPFIIKARNGVQLSGIGVSSFRIPNIEKELKKREVKLELAEKIISNVEFSQDGIDFLSTSSLDGVSAFHWIRFSFSKYHAKCFIFAHSHSVAQRASVFLNARGWSNTLLSGKMEQASRTQAWEQLVTKETNILVATGMSEFIITAVYL